MFAFILKSKETKFSFRTFVLGEIARVSLKNRLKETPYLCYGNCYII